MAVDSGYAAFVADLLNLGPLPIKGVRRSNVAGSGGGESLLSVQQIQYDLLLVGCIKRHLNHCVLRCCASHHDMLDNVTDRDLMCLLGNTLKWREARIDREYTPPYYQSKQNVHSSPR